MSNISDDQQPLYWEFSFEIVQALMNRYPEIDVNKLGLQELFELIVTLPNFADDLELANDGLLTEILREYYEEVIDL